VTQSVHANVCCKRLFGRYTDQVSRAPASIQFSPPPTSPRERSNYHFESKEALGYAVVERKSQNLRTTGGCVPMQSEGDAIDILIGRCPAYTR